MSGQMQDEPDKPGLKISCSMAPRWVKRQVTFVEPGMRWDRIRMRPSQARHWKMQIKHFPKVLSKWNYNLNWHTQPRWAAPQGERLSWCHDGLDPAYIISGFPFSRMIASWRDSIIALNILGVSKTSFIGTSSPGSFWSMVNRNSKILSYEMSDGRTKNGWNTGISWQDCRQKTSREWKLV